MMRLQMPDILNISAINYFSFHFLTWPEEKQANIYVCDCTLADFWAENILLFGIEAQDWNQLSAQNISTLSYNISIAMQNL